LNIKLIRDLQEKYNQAVLFYQTGRLGMSSLKIWEQIDIKFQLTQKADLAKRLAMERAVKFNTLFNYDSSIGKFTNQVNDIWQVIMTAPKSAKKLDSKYQITSKLVSFSKGVYSTAKEGISELVSRGSDDYVKPKRSPYKSPFSYQKGDYNDGVLSRLKGFIFGSGAGQKYRLARVNPWDSPFKSLPVFRRNRNKRQNRFIRFV